MKDIQQIIVYDCPVCKYRIDRGGLLSLRGNLTCPRCGLATVSDFVRVMYPQKPEGAVIT